MFDLTDIAVGDTVDVRGFENPTGSGNLIATRLEREEPDTTVVVGEFFEATTPPEFTILGITIDATAAAFTRDRNTHVDLRPVLHTGARPCGVRRRHTERYDRRRDQRRSIDA